MTLKQQENIRLILFLASFGSSMLHGMGAYDMVGFTEFLESNGVTIEDIQNMLSTLGNVSILSAGWMEQISKEHKEINGMYDEVIYNIGDLFRIFRVDTEPVQAFALYVYLYRMGYFSVNHQFVYKFDMKDFARLGGVDVVLGTGVCRSIAAMFTDICKNMDMKAYSVAVKVKDRNMQDERERLCPIELQHETKDNFLTRAFGKMGEYLPIGNHMITEIDSHGYNMAFDPTNDYLLKLNGRKYTILGSEGCYMTRSYVSGVLPVVLGQSNGDLTIQRDAMTKSISFSEYKEVYRELLERIESSLSLFEMFYQENLPYYQEIERVAKSQHSMIKRYMPILPIK